MNTEYFPTAGPTMHAFNPWYNELTVERSHHLQRANQTIGANLSAEANEANPSVEANPTSVEASPGFSQHESRDFTRRMQQAAHKHPLYQNATRRSDRLYHCPFRVDGKCKHEPQSKRYKFLYAFPASCIHGR
ncbi:hypothetical protein BKA56DRAFT_603509 [Ilyonectria sp. MPI-CAGE-AT-0026]|nr:hypothetical protein BKA56DRAFT_603509 [Ilyonectria sp. MPI-CAGE-AT-0026]